MRELAKLCNFCSDQCAQKSIRDQIIEGLVDGDVVENLLREKELTLDATIAKCRAQEAARKQRAEIVGGGVNIQAVHKPEMQRTPAYKPCPGCGSAPRPGGRQQCPAATRTCHYCKKVGHLAKVCWQREMDPAHPLILLELFTMSPPWTLMRINTPK